MNPGVGAVTTPAPETSAPRIFVLVIVNESRLSVAFAGRTLVASCKFPFAAITIMSESLCDADVVPVISTLVTETTSVSFGLPQSQSQVTLVVPHAARIGTIAIIRNMIAEIFISFFML